MAGVQLRRGFVTESEKRSEQLRNDLELNPHGPLCGFELAKKLDVKVLTPFDVGIPNEDAEELMRDGAWSAVCLKGQSGKFGIVHNVFHSKARQQSNIMHEMAHIILEHEPKVYSQPIPWFMRQHDPIHEEEAKALGSILQIPREGLLRALKGGASRDQIANTYVASMKMVEYRIRKTGVLRQLGYRKRA